MYLYLLVSWLYLIPRNRIFFFKYGCIAICLNVWKPAHGLTNALLRSPWDSRPDLAIGSLPQLKLGDHLDRCVYFFSLVEGKKNPGSEISSPHDGTGARRKGKLIHVLLKMYLTSPPPLGTSFYIFKKLKVVISGDKSS